MCTLVRTEGTGSGRAQPGAGVQRGLLGPGSDVPTPQDGASTVSLPRCNRACEIEGRHDSLPSKGVLGRIEGYLEIDPGNLLLRKTRISCMQTLRGSGHWLGKR